MTKRLIFPLILMLAAVPAMATDNCASVPSATTLAWNGLEATPAMGWNSFYAFNTSPTEAELKNQADLLVSSGLKAAGYTQLGVDDGWQAAARVGGNLVANATNFPDGMAATITYVHGDGLTFGIYSSPYTSTCDGFIGSGLNESADASTFASWGADYLKYDGCSVSSLYASCWSTKNQQVWQMMAQDIRATGRSIAMEIGTNQPTVGTGMGGSAYEMDTDLQWAQPVGYNEVYFNNVNIFGGGGSGWSTITGTYMPLAASLYQYEKPGYFPDCDMLIGQTENSSFGTFTQTQSQTQMGLYALWGCPLRLGMDISTLSSPMLAIYKNPGVIAVDQDSLARAGFLYQTFTCGSTICQIWVRPLHDGTWAVGFVNLDTAAHTVAMNFTNFGGNPDVYDLWAASDLGTMTSYSVSVASDGIAMLKVTPAAGAAHQISNAALKNMAIH